MIVPEVRLLLAGDHAEERRLAGAVGADDPDDAAGRQLERKLVDEQPVAVALREIDEVDHVLTEPLGDGNDDLRRRRRLLVALLDQFVVGGDARLGLGLPRFRRRGDPLAFLGERALAGGLLAAFLLEPLLLLLEPGRIIALVGNAAAAIELENPARDVVEEVAIVGDDEDRARIGAQMPLEPVDGLGVEMVGRLVEQEEVGLLEQEAAKGDAAALAARKRRHLRVVGRAAERVHRLLDLAVEIPQALGLDLVLKPGHLVGRLVGIVHREFIVAVEDRLLVLDAEHRVALHVELGVELRLLRQVSDPGAFGDEALADELGVEARHDAQQRRLARAVDAEHADLGVRVERQVDVLEHLLAARPGLAEALHMIDELARGHAIASLRIRELAACLAGGRDGNKRALGQPFSQKSGQAIRAQSPIASLAGNEPAIFPERTRGRCARLDQDPRKLISYKYFDVPADACFPDRICYRLTLNTSRPYDGVDY